MANLGQTIHVLFTRIVALLRLPSAIIIGWSLGLAGLGWLLLAIIANVGNAGTFAVVIISCFLVTTTAAPITFAVVRAQILAQLRTVNTRQVAPAAAAPPSPEDLAQVQAALGELNLALADDRGVAGRATAWLYQGRWRGIGKGLARIERVQRAAVSAAGGVENAPYLRLDLRYVVLSGLATCVSIFAGFVMVVILFLWWIVPF